MADNMDISKSIAGLQSQYDQQSSNDGKDKMYQELLQKYEVAQKRIEELETEKNKSKLPTKDEIEAMSGMLDLVNKLDTSTIEKLTKFGKQ